ncbi:unnamed protein product [Protopolystoma xenopodis]|uniref:Uncharacterized protein n=1 Tax=Protopolystoma xenopodis TaxID=117903 RepID=A0A3S4ZTM7_9PLAT|nr:unnamed protein product [Protopolystoma xenopodis]
MEGKGLDGFHEGHSCERVAMTIGRQKSGIAGLPWMGSLEKIRRSEAAKLVVLARRISKPKIGRSADDLLTTKSDMHFRWGQPVVIVHLIRQPVAMLYPDQHNLPTLLVSTFRNDENEAREQERGHLLGALLWLPEQFH